LKASLLEFEDRLPWTCVTRGFASSRGTWRKDLAHATTLRQFVRSYKDFLQVRNLYVQPLLAGAAARSTCSMLMVFLGARWLCWTVVHFSHNRL
jgi:hypothetical protein